MKCSKYLLIFEKKAEMELILKCRAVVGRERSESHLSGMIGRLGVAGLAGRTVAHLGLGRSLGPHGAGVLEVEVHHGALAVLHHLPEHPQRPADYHRRRQQHVQYQASAQDLFDHTLFLQSTHQYF